MRRFGGITALYAVVAAIVVAAPLSASEPPAGAPQPAVPEAPAPAAPAPAEEAPSVQAPAVQPPAAQPPAPAAAPAPAAPAPAAAAPAPAPEPQVLRDEGPVEADKPVKAKAAASASVTISDFQFAPGAVTVNVGDTVTWTNAGPTPHSATANDGSFDTGIMDEGGSGSHTFTEAGTFSYICTPHPNMTGTVTVAAAAGDDTGAGDESGTTGTTGTGAQAEDDGPALPATGMDVAGLALLGLFTLALGAYLRRRTEPAPVRPAGRIGW
jgi:LPXTG-motif cell wall-anchored protein